MSQELQRIEPEHESGELVPYNPPPPPSLFGTDDPVEVVSKASRVADALKAVLSDKGLISKISGKEYPRCEAWTLLGTMLGVFPVLCWSRPVEGGWEARVEAKTLAGVIVGAAEAQCLKTERNWRDRDDFALRSMAQTRATAKALRMPLGFVMTLGGYQATPAEEMDFEREPKQPERKPANAPRGTKASSAPSAPATEDQRQRWIGALKLRGEWALGYCYDKGWLLPESGPDNDRSPAEPLEALDVRHVPTTRKAADAILAELDALIPADQRAKMGINPQTASKTAQDDLKAPVSRAQAQNATQTAKRTPSTPQNAPNESQDHHKADWYNFPMPWGKKAGTPLGKLDKKYLYGLWKNHIVETEWKGKPIAKDKVEADKHFRVMLDQAGVHYRFDEPKDGANEDMPGIPEGESRVPEEFDSY